jgi:Zn-dependent peptidase ImmA (M78 family)/transcriptional regulator with XRE-family HTH domain
LAIDVAPGILSWARETVGVSVGSAAKYLKISDATLVNWETGRGKPSLVHLTRLANLYKRPLAVFFLSVPPNEPGPPNDFRKLPLEREQPYSKKALLAIRRARRIQYLAKDLGLPLDRKPLEQLGRLDLSQDPEIVSKRIRDRLNISTQTQFSWANESVALEAWINHLEELGFLVLRIGMPLDDGRAFSLHDEFFPVIALNARDWPPAKIFSLFHECGHLMMGEDGICNDLEGNLGRIKPKEVYCNKLAGAVLVPRDSLLEDETVKSQKDHSFWPEEELGKISQRFKVSREVVLRRLTMFGRATNAFYQRKLTEWKAAAGDSKTKSKTLRSRPANRSLRENGSRFSSLVLTAYRQGSITYADVGEFLGVRFKHLPRIEQLLSERR